MADTLKEIEIDALGEILNISMGSAATAVSTMLDTKVEITTPQVVVKKLNEINSSMYEPAMIVKITYVEGISGSNVMVFRQKDMQEILAKLMGMEVSEDTPFEFDEIAISAACEVMNQMMGSYATALSEFLGRTIDISPPDAYLMDEEHTFKDAIGKPPNDDVVSTNFNLVIGDTINSEYMSVMTVDLAKTLVSPFVGGGLLDENPIEDNSQPKAQGFEMPFEMPPAPSAPQQPASSAPPLSSSPAGAPAAPPVMPQAHSEQSAPSANPYGAMPMNPPMPPDAAMYAQQQYGAMPQGYAAYPPYPPSPYGYGYPTMYPPAAPYPQSNLQHVEREPVNVQNLNLPKFNMAQPMFNAPVSGNIDLIMNVPLGVSVELGRTKRKVKEILDFTQGTVIELEKQAGASADIIVNGQLIARGDVVVMDDNFGVRITEIINVKDLIANGEAPKE